jgi:hypothetical protein
MNAKNFNTNTDNKDEWLTPKYITDCLGEFDLDPCSPAERRPWDTAKEHWGIDSENPKDGLSEDWFGRVWCNPPYGRETFKWLDKLAAHGSGIALIFARTETIGFHESVWNKAHSVMFFKGRLKFWHVDGVEGGTSNAPSVLVSYSEYDTDKIREALTRGDIKGKLVLV